MWQRFTEPARRVVFFAQEEAGNLGENYISTEHLLLGLIRENDSLAARILDRLGISLGRIGSEVRRQVARGDGRVQDMQLTPRGKRVLDLARDESQRNQHAYIGTEHLLIGLMREDGGLAGIVLRKLGADLDGVRAIAHSLKPEPQGDSPPQLPVFPAEPGTLGVVTDTDTRGYTEVAYTAEVFLKLVDIYRAKDTHGYRFLQADPNSLFFIPAGTPVRRLVLTDGNSIALSHGVPIRVEAGEYAGYSGWVFASNVAFEGNDTGPFPPPITE